jgi:hypothetical protein
MWFDVVTLVWCRLEKVLRVGRWIDFVDFEVSVVNVDHVHVVVHALTVNIVCQVRISGKPSTKHGNLPATRACFFLLIRCFDHCLRRFCIGVFGDDGG